MRALRAVRAVLGTLLLVVLVVPEEATGHGRGGRTAARTRRGHRQPMARFLGAFLDAQSKTIAPAYISGVVCSWSRYDVSRTFSLYGLAARIIVVPAGDSASAPADAQADAPRTNALFQPAKVRPAALAALRPPALGAWLLGLAGRGKPATPDEDAYAEELFVDMSCAQADLVMELVRFTAGRRRPRQTHHDMLFQASEMNLFRRPFRWVLLQSRCADGVLAASAASTPRAALVDSQVTVACREAEGTVRAFEVHRAALGASPSVASLASWTAAGLVVHLSKRGDVLRTLQGVTVHTGIALLDSNDSIHHLTDGAEKELDQLTKTTFTILLQAYQLMNATISLHVTNSHGYLRDGKMDGLLGAMARGAVEVGGTCTLPVAFRMLALVYSGFNIPMRAITLFRQPPLAYTDNVFWLPFPDSLWAASLGLVALCCLLTVVALYLEPQADALADAQHGAVRHHGVGKGAPKQALRASMSDVFLLAFGAIAQQGSPVEARGGVARLVTFLLFLAVLLLYTCYSASIVVLLQSSSSSIRTLRDLWKSRLDLAAENMPYNVYFLRQMAVAATDGDEVRRGLYFDKLAPKGRQANFISMAEGVRRLREGLFAFVAIDSPLYGHVQANFEEHEKCDLFETVDSYSPLRHPHLVTRRDSPVAHLLKIKLLLHWERGFRARFILRGLHGKPRCDTQGARFMSVSFVGARSAYYLVLGGVTLAVVVLLAELLHVRLARSRSPSQDADDSAMSKAEQDVAIEPRHQAWGPLAGGEVPPGSGVSEPENSNDPS